jgi:two-component system phosphate regulon sensor histidine kinase PhoR
MALFARPRLPEGSHRRDEAMEAVLRVSEIASSERPLQTAVADMLVVAVELLEAERGSIMLLEDGGRHLVLVASSGLSSEVPLGHRLAVGESVAGRVLATGKPLLLDNVDEDAFVNFVPKSRPIASSVVVPLRAQGRAIGVLNLAISQPPSSFTQEDLRVAQVFADQAGGLIHRARLHERAERRSSDLLALGESSRALVGTLELDALLQHVLDGGARLLAARDGFVCLFEPDRGSITAGVFRGVEKPTIRRVVADPGVKEAVLSRSVTAVALADGRELVAIGLRTTRGTNGLLAVGTHGDIEDDRKELLRAFAQQCATALGAAEIYAMVQRKESELSAIIASVANPIVLVDSRGTIVDLNPAAEELFGVAAAFSAGMSAADALRHVEIETLLQGKGLLQSEISIGTPPRTYRVRVTDVAIPNSSTGRVLILEDITAEREIAQKQRDFVAMIGHELRTPLTIIKGFARTALKTIDSASRDQRTEILGTIDAKADQLERLIQDLLYVSKIESREATLRVEDIDMGALAEAVIEDTLQQYPVREVELDLSPGLCWPCDETKVGLVLRHLIDNALKFSAAPYPVVVHAFVASDELRIDVADRGKGLLSSDIPHIFERFRQLDSSSTREQGGTGVGLYLCAQLMRIQGGRIWVDSAWGKGSTFSVAIPRRATTKRIVARAERAAG